MTEGTDRRMTPERLAEIAKRRELLLTVSPFDHGKWIQAQSILITDDVPALLAEVDRLRQLLTKDRCCGHARCPGGSLCCCQEAQARDEPNWIRQIADAEAAYRKRNR